MDTFSEGMNGPRVIAESYRARVRNLSAATIDAVTVSLERFQPQNAPFLPVPLRLLGDDSFTWRQSREGRRLNAKGRLYAGAVVLRYPTTFLMEEFELQYASQGLPNMIPNNQRYELTLVASHDQ